MGEIQGTGCDLILGNMARARSGITAFTLAALLEPLAKAGGKNFLMFSEEKDLHKVKVEGPKCLAMAFVLEPIRNVDESMSFKKSVVEDAFLEVAAQVGQDMKLKEEHFGVWAQVMSLRLRNLVAAIRNAEARPAPPQWVSKLPWHAKPSKSEKVAVGPQLAGTSTASTTAQASALAASVDGVPTAAASGQVAEVPGSGQVAEVPVSALADGAIPGWQLATAEAFSASAVLAAAQGDAVVPFAGVAQAAEQVRDEQEVKFYFDWKPELQIVFRESVDVPVHLRGKAGDACLPLEPPADANDDDPVIAMWEDGVTYTIPGLKVRDFKAGLRRSVSREPPLWQGCKVVDGHEVTIDQRTDRFLLCCIWEQGRQVLQIRAELWGDLPSPQPSVVEKSHPTIRACLAFLTPLAEKFCDGSIADAVNLKHARDVAMKSIGLSAARSVRQLSKRLESDGPEAGAPASDKGAAPAKRQRRAAKATSPAAQASVSPPAKAASETASPPPSAKAASQASVAPPATEAASQASSLSRGAMADQSVIGENCAGDEKKKKHAIWGKTPDLEIGVPPSPAPSHGVAGTTCEGGSTSSRSAWQKPRFQSIAHEMEDDIDDVTTEALITLNEDFSPVCSACACGGL